MIFMPIIYRALGVVIRRFIVSKRLLDVKLVQTVFGIFLCLVFESIDISLYTNVTKHAAVTKRSLRKFST